MVRVKAALTLLLALVVSAMLSQAAHAAGGATGTKAPGDCTIGLECSGGSIISCNGTNNQCSLGSNYVECNGVRTTCPSAPCSASLLCSNGSTVSCTGTNNTCITGSNYVECNGLRKTCRTLTPNPCPATVFCFGDPNCPLSCNSTTGHCSKTSNSVTCNGVTKTCSQFVCP